MKHRFCLIVMFLLWSVSPVEAGIIELLSDKTKRSIGSLFGGKGSDVFEIEIKASPVSHDGLVQTNTSQLNRTFICDLRKEKLRTCVNEGSVSVREAFVPRDRSAHYYLHIKGYERDPELHDLYFSVETERGYHKVIGFSASNTKPLTFSYEDLPLEQETSLTAFYQVRRQNFVKLQISVREIDPSSDF